MTFATASGLVAVALVVAMAGGAITGTRIAGEFLGRELAAMMGAFFGPVAVLPATILGVALLAWWH